MLTRRKFLRAVAITGAVTAFSGTVPGISAFAATPTRIRRSVNNMALDDPDLATYRDFVGLMQSMPQTQKVSWLGFANQHGDENGFKYCPHGDWYFLPWHRGYVDMYEKAAMTLMKNPAFAMPYWDWTTLRQLPAAFTSKTYKGKPNPLYVPGRGDKPSMVRNTLTGVNALTDKLVGPDVLKNIYKETVFEVFGTSRNPKQNNLDPKWVPMGGGTQGILEATPHNNVHNNIGAFMPQSNSPRDPIFMMHHSNIDRIWANWTALGRQNSSDSLWLNMPFTNNYIAPDGTLYTKVVKDLQSTTALGYSYENLPRPDHLVANPRRRQNLAALFDPKVNGAAMRIKKTNKLAAKMDAQLSMPFTLEPSLFNSLIAPPGEKAHEQEMVAIISNIEIGDNVRAIRIFLNSETVTQNVPDTDLHFVTTISFLRHKGDHGQSLPSAIINLTETLVKLRQAKQLSGDTITVQLLPVPEPGAAVESVGKVIPAAIEIAVI